MSKAEKNNLPQGWTDTTLGNIGEYLNGRAFKKHEWGNKGRPIIRIQDLTGTGKEPNYYDGEVDDRYVIRHGDFLISWSATLGAYLWKGPEGVLNQHIFKVISKIDRLFHYYVVSNTINELYRHTHGSGMVHITKAKFEAVSVKLPPLNEQKRIVAKIEQLFSDLDAGVKTLHALKKQIKQYRQSVLKHAFEGKLTAQWRKKNNPEPASKLLAKIAKEKEQKSKGKKQKKLPPLDTSDLPNLPKGWCWTRVVNITVEQQYGTSDKALGDESGIPVLRMGNIQDGKLVYDKLKYFPLDYEDVEKFRLFDGDVLFNRTNSAELVGKTAVYKKSYPDSIFASYLIRIKLSESILPDILAYYINSYYGRQYINSVVSQQVGQANVNGTKLSMMAVPAISFEEQNTLLTEIERHFSIADKAQEVVDTALKQSTRLRQSILKCAFEGKLVLQDPTDEPAEVLLDRINQEKRT